MKISKVLATEIIDSRGFPTIEVFLQNTDNFFASASSPSGASTGSLEAIEHRDGDPIRFKGKGVLNAVKFINEFLSRQIISKDFTSQLDFDNFILGIDSTKNKSLIGGNVSISLSMAFAKLKALNDGLHLYDFLERESKSSLNLEKLNISSNFLKTLPVPMMNIINGGKHADNSINIQEFMIMPVNCDSFSKAIEIGGNVFHCLKDILKKSGFNINVGDEGGFAPDLKDPREAFDLIIRAINIAGYQEGKDVLLAIDCAASEFFDDSTGSYSLFKDKKPITANEMISFYQEIVKDYPIFSIEDPLSEHDLPSAKQMTGLMKNKVQIVGDDFFVTNLDVFKERSDIGNAILIKPNQIGTVSEAIKMVNYASFNNFNCIASHRSGETEDTFIADFAFGTFCNQIKTGSLCRTDRNCKYNQLLRIENRMKMEGVSLDFNGRVILDQFKAFNIS